MPLGQLAHPTLVQSEVGWRRVPGSVRHVCDRQVWRTKEVQRSLTPPRHYN